MSSDLARLSFDRTRRYHALIAQQGRVTLEADVNEARIIAEEAVRHEMIDIIGPAGTPDNGYKISSGSSASDLLIGAGTMFVGGWRLSLPVAVHYDAQPDWLNNLQTALPVGQQLIALLVTEQSVSAVEDNALFEIALGGPDTAARSRLMQHFLSMPSGGATCAIAETALEAALTANGLVIDPLTLEVTSTATLAVGFYPPTAPADPCEPAAQNGYLGADNQLVRVSVTAYNGQTGTLVWGWNNASTLFRATIVDAQTLALAPPPVDAAHTPQQGQAIEVLRTQCVLGQAAEQNFIAAAQGVVMTLSQTTAVFNGDTNQLSLASPLPPDYQKEPNSLFVRLWQSQVRFTAEQPAQLDSTSGLQVTLNITALPTGSFVTARPFWNFAVRPNTPQQVYPQRYLNAPQPPDGPRQWLCKLAVVLSQSMWPPGQAINSSNITSFAPAALVFSNQLYVFWRSEDSSEHLYYSTSSDGTTFSSGTLIDETDTTAIGPAACAFNGSMYLFWQATDGNNSLAYSTSSGAAWQPGQRLNGTDSTSATPAAAVFNDSLYLFWKSNDPSNLNAIYYSSLSGAIWPQGTRLPGATTQTAPCACAFNGVLYVFWSAPGSGGASESGELYVASWDGNSWSSAAPINSSDTSPSAPAATVYDGQIWLFWRASDGSNAIYTTASSDGVSWQPARMVNSTDNTPASVAAVVFNNQLYLFWTTSPPNAEANQIFWSAA